MKKFVIGVASVITVFGLVFLASAAPTSTPVQSLIITGLKSTPTVHLTVDSSGLVGTSTAGGTSVPSTTINTLANSANAFFFTAAGTGLSVASSGTSTIGYTWTNPGYLSNASITATSPITWSAGSVIACATCITGNQTITLKLQGDATGTASGATSITVTSTVTAIQGKTVTSSAPSAGDLFQFDGTLWQHNPTSTVLSGYSTSTGANPTASAGTSATNGSANTFMRSDAAPSVNQAGTYAFSALGNTTSTGNIGGSTINASTSITNQGVKNALVLDSSTGLQGAYAGSSCAAGSMVTSISATGTVSCQATSTILSGYSTSTGANPTATIGTTAVNGSANTFMRSDGAPKLGSQFASSSVAFSFRNATTTAPSSFLSVKTNTLKTIAQVDCSEFAAATTTMMLYYNTTNASTGIQQIILSSLACGIGGGTTTTFTTSTLPAGAYLFAIVSSTAGTPTLTTVHVDATKQ